MSLINDALKRASQADRNRPRPPQTPTHASMEPAPEQRGGFLPLVLGAVVVLAVGLAGWFFWQWWRVSHPPSPARAPIAAVAPKPAPPPVAQKAVAPPVASAPPSNVVASTPAPVPAPAPAPTPEPAPPPPAKPVVPPWPAELKLGGIFFSKTNPFALINGKSVNEGDEIDGIRVTKIERDKVTVEWNGQVKVLVIE
jgi:hypothetical protein